MIDPILLILAPPALVFGWASLQMHRSPQEVPDRAHVKLDA